MYLMIMNIATPIPKNVLDDPALCRHDPPNMVPKLAHSFVIIKTWLLVQSIALDVLYQNIHHIYKAIVQIATAIPKNVLDDPALC